MRIAFCLLACMTAAACASSPSGPDQSAFIDRISTMDCGQLQAEGDRVMAARDRQVSDALTVSGRNATAFRANTRDTALAQLRLIIDQGEALDGESCRLRIEDRRMVRDS